MSGIYFVLNLDKTNDLAVIRDNESKTAAYAETKKAADEFKSNLSNAKIILDNQVPYTKLITTIANILPADAQLDTLTLNPTTFGTPTTLTIHTKSYQSAIDVKQYMQKATNIFEDVNFQSVAQSEVGGSDFSYTAIYNVTISKKAANL
jgi:glyceraldehyde-3-phosphate dehydrogenase/erythrose-4-phosphate dehydrogenase